MIEAAYPSNIKSNNEQLTFDIWCEMLADEEWGKVMINLKNHIKSSSYLPTINDLLKSTEVLKEGTKYIPSVEETTLYIESINNMKSDVSEERRKEHLENIRKILYKQEG